MCVMVLAAADIGGRYIHFLQFASVVVAKPNCRIHAHSCNCYLKFKAVNVVIVRMKCVHYNNTPMMIAVPVVKLCGNCIFLLFYAIHVAVINWDIFCHVL